MKSDLSIFYSFLCVVCALFKEIFKFLEICYLGPAVIIKTKIFEGEAWVSVVLKTAGVIWMCILSKNPYFDKVQS